jgi:Ca2+/H+ antiporter, TMEM165/GDT1 family
MRTLGRRRWYFIPPLIIIGITAFGFITMTLWNALLPNILHLPTINFWQAIGLLILSRLLFGGGPWHKGGHHPWKNHMREKWEKMTPEEREQFRQKLHHSHPWGNFCREHPKEDKKDDIA